MKHTIKYRYTIIYEIYDNWIELVFQKKYVKNVYDLRRNKYVNPEDNCEYENF